MGNDVSQVINRTALIENLLNQAILHYSSPRKDAFIFFWEVLLDSSVISLGSKVKVVTAISQQLKVKLDSEELHKVISYRNAFAHHATDAHPFMAVGKTPEEDKLHHRLYIMKMSGKIEKKNRKEALIEFNKSYKSARESLVRIISVIKNHVQENEETAT